MKNLFQWLMLGLLVSFATACSNHHASYFDFDELEPYKLELILAASRNNVEEMNHLARQGVNINAHDGVAISSAADSGSLEVVQWLIENRANVNVQAECASTHCKGLIFFIEGGTPLIAAAGSGHTEIVSELIRAGALVNRADKKGMTPLMWAAQFGRSEVVRELIRHQVDVNQRDNEGRTALWHARNGGYNTSKTRKKLVRILKRAGAEEDCPRSCLKYAPCIIRSLGEGVSFLFGL